MKKNKKIKELVLWVFIIPWKDIKYLTFRENCFFYLTCIVEALLLKQNFLHIFFK